MPPIEKTPAEWAQWIADKFASPTEPAELAAFVQGIIISAPPGGRDLGLEVAAQYFEGLADECPDESTIAGRSMWAVLRAFGDHLRSLKKGQAK